MSKSVCRLICEQENERRAVLLLEYPRSRYVTASRFQLLSPPDRNRFKTRFTKWVAGAQLPEKQYHTFSRQAYRTCCQFRSDDHRLYGFLASSTRRRFQACVLVTLVEKHEAKTDMTYLDRINTIRIDDVVVATLTEYMESDFD